MRPFATCITLGITAACSGPANLPLPQIADRLPSDVRAAQVAFDQRVKTSFPLGTPETNVVASLRKSGFEIGPQAGDGYRSANIERGGGVCKTLWSVRWKAKTGLIANMVGVYGLQCL